MKDHREMKILRIYSADGLMVKSSALFSSSLTYHVVFLSSSSTKSRNNLSQFTVERFCSTRLRTRQWENTLFLWVFSSHGSTASNGQSHQTIEAFFLTNFAFYPALKYGIVMPCETYVTEEVSKKIFWQILLLTLAQWINSLANTIIGQ